MILTITFIILKYYWVYWSFNVNHQFRIVFCVCSFVYLPQEQGLHLGFLQSEHLSLTSGSLPQTDEHRYRDQFYAPQWNCLDMIVLTLSLLSWSCSMTFIFRRVSSSFLSSWRRLSIVDESFYSIPAHKNTTRCL